MRVSAAVPYHRIVLNLSASFGSSIITNSQFITAWPTSNDDRIRAVANILPLTPNHIPVNFVIELLRSTNPHELSNSPIVAPNSLAFADPSVILS